MHDTVHQELPGPLVHPAGRRDRGLWLHRLWPSGGTGAGHEQDRIVPRAVRAGGELPPEEHYECVHGTIADPPPATATKATTASLHGRDDADGWTGSCGAAAAAAKRLQRVEQQ